MTTLRFGCLLVACIVSSAMGAEINGTVAQVGEQTITISSPSDVLPAVGDKLNVFVEIPGVGRATVATARIVSVEGGAFLRAKIDKATGTIKRGQLVAIESASPTKRPPPDIGLTTWGTPINPDGDCKIQVADDQVTVTIPAKKHDLSWDGKQPETRYNAPRVLQSVRGDFLAHVKLTADWTLGAPLPTGQNAFAAGLLVWDSEQQYLRHERILFNDRRRGTTHTFVPPIYDRDKARHSSIRAAAPDYFKGRSTWLLLERRGNTFRTAISHDGANWERTNDVEAQFPTTVQIGIHAINASGRVLEVKFEDFRLEQTTSAIQPATPAVAPSGMVSRLNGPNEGTRDLVKAATNLLTRHHLSKRSLDDEIAERAYNEFLLLLDPRKLYFLQADVDEFGLDKLRIDNKLREGDLAFAYAIFQRYLSRADARLQFAQQSVTEAHDFTVDEVITTSESPHYPADEDEAHERWRKRVKYDLLKEHVAGTSLWDAQRKLRQRYAILHERVFKLTDDDLVERVLTALLRAYDPHSSFISRRAWEDFAIANESQLVGIGAALKQQDGDTVVAKIISGSPAHDDGRLQSGDRILAVGQGRDGDLVDIAGLGLRDVVSLIRGQSGTIVRLRVASVAKFEANTYDLTRRKFDVAKARAAILTGDRLPDQRQGKLGFIHLPSFYGNIRGDQQGQEPASSASDDVRRILQDFERQGVEAVILDLRTNSGGMLTEAINLTGLFIDTGPVLQIKGRDGRTQQYDDSERGAAWNKPLVVLTSESTSSGAEILAGALQDYGRALILGNATTQGSGIVYTLLDIGQEMSSRDPLNHGKMRVAKERFYLPSGKSTQVRGIVPHVITPSAARFVTPEAKLRFHLDYDEVSPAAFTRLDYGITEENLAWLRKQHDTRTASSSHFQRLRQRLAAVREQQARGHVSLHKAKYVAEQSRLANSSEAPRLPEIRDVVADGYLDEVASIALDYVARQTFLGAEADFKRKRYDEAIARYVSAVASAPQFVNGHYKLAWILSTCPSSRHRDGELAVVHAKKAIELDREGKWAYTLALAVAHAEAGDFDAAQEELTKALEAAPASGRKSFQFLQQRFRNRQSYSRR